MNDESLSPRDQEIIEKAKKSKTSASKKAASAKNGLIEKKARKKSLESTIKQVQVELEPSKRLISKFIHNRFVEIVSDFLAATLARPNAILAGSVVSFVLTLSVYVISKTIGYEISGFETIAAFILGWIIGILYDYLHLLITGK
jgi:hypothetical protein